MLVLFCMLLSVPPNGASTPPPQPVPPPYKPGLAEDVINGPPSQVSAIPARSSVSRQSRRAAGVVETELVVKITPPDNLYGVLITPKDIAPKGERVYWSIYPHKGVKSVERDNAHWHVKVPPGTYESSYTTYVDGEQVDSFTEFTVGNDPTPPGPPNPPPPPVDDPDYARVKAAYDSDTPLDKTDRKACGLRLTAYYLDAARACRASGATTIAKFFQDINARATIDLGSAGEGKLKTFLPATRRLGAIAGEAVFGPDVQRRGDEVIDAAKREALAKVYDKYAKLVEAVSK